MSMILDKPILFTIVGSSGSGKTIAAEYAGKQHGIPVLSSYTTRPKRAGETNGKEHTFVTPEEMPPHSEMIAYTLFGGHHYWATRSQVDGKGAILYVIDEVGLEELLSRFEKIYYIVPIYIECKEKPWIKDKDRLDRDKNRRLLPPSTYRAVIINNGSLTDFLTLFSNVIGSLLNDSPEVNISDWCRNRAGLPSINELQRQWQRL